MHLWIICCLITFISVWVLIFLWEGGLLRSLSMKLKIDKRGIYLIPPTVEENQMPVDCKDAMITGCRPSTSFARRSLTTLGRPLRSRAILLATLWVTLMTCYLVFAKHLGSNTYFLILATSASLIFAHIRSCRRYLSKLILSTACSNCGLCPMKYVARSDDEHHLLVCDRCRIEWDLGPSN